MSCDNNCCCGSKTNISDFAKELTEFKSYIENSESILILTHVNPDGDTISSALALTLVLEKYYNKTAIPVYIRNFPKIYDFLPNVEKFQSNEKIDKNKQYDLVIAIDIASKERMNDLFTIFENAKYNINIDHHKTNNNYGKLNFVDGNASSAGEVLFDIFEKSNLMLDKDISTCLYTSMLTDTGGFKYENTSPKVLMIAGVLAAGGANPTKIFKACYESKPQAMVQLQAFAINNAIFLENGKIAYTIITNDIMKQFNATDDLTDGISEALRQINTVEVSMVLKETSDNYTKVSLRSKRVDVSKIASNFNGGGHEFAAGCTIKKPINIALGKILEYIKREL